MSTPSLSRSSIVHDAAPLDIRSSLSVAEQLCWTPELQLFHLFSSQSVSSHVRRLGLLHLLSVETTRRLRRCLVDRFVGLDGADHSLEHPHRWLDYLSSSLDRPRTNDERTSDGQIQEQRQSSERSPLTLSSPAERRSIV